MQTRVRTLHSIMKNEVQLLHKITNVVYLLPVDKKDTLKTKACELDTAVTSRI